MKRGSGKDRNMRFPFECNVLRDAMKNSSLYEALTLAINKSPSILNYNSLTLSAQIWSKHEDPPQKKLYLKGH